MSGFGVADFPALGTTVRVVVGDPTVLRAARKILATELAELDRTASRFRADSELTRLNRSGSARHVSRLLFDVLTVARRAAAMTDGLVNPFVGRTLRLAGYDTTFEAVARRDDGFMPRFVSVPDWRRLELEPGRRTVRIPRGAELDLGATAKAYAADRAAQSIVAATGVAALVSLGGDVAVGGVAPNGGWPIRIAEHHGVPPEGPGPAVAVAGGGLATSSTTARRWRSRAGELHHVVDPRTGRPAETPFRTVTVAAATCVDANVASTASLVLGSEAIRWLRTRGLPARLVSTDGSVVHTCGWSERAA